MPRVSQGPKTWSAHQQRIRNAIRRDPARRRHDHAARGEAPVGRGGWTPLRPFDPPWKEIETMMTKERPYCQVAGCHQQAARCVEVDLPLSWEATRTFTTATVVVGLCCEHGHD